MLDSGLSLRSFGEKDRAPANRPAWTDSFAPSLPEVLDAVRTPSVVLRLVIPFRYGNLKAISEIQFTATSFAEPALPSV